MDKLRIWIVFWGRLTLYKDSWLVWLAVGLAIDWTLCAAAISERRDTTSRILCAWHGVRNVS